MVPKRGEGGMLTGGVRGSSWVMTLLVGSKKATLGGVGGAITIARAVKVADVGVGGSGGGGRRSRDGEVLKNPGTFATRCYIWTV